MNVDLFGNVIVEQETVEEIVQSAAPSKRSPFDFTNSISDKRYIDDIDGYVAYLTNVSFSNRVDTVFYANEMNKYHNLPEQMQYDFYYHGLAKKKYFAKWAKPVKSKYREAIKEYYNVSSKVAVQYEKTLMPDQLKKIQKWFDDREGGK